MHTPIAHSIHRHRICPPTHARGNESYNHGDSKIAPKHTKLLPPSICDENLKSARKAAAQRSICSSFAPQRGPRSRSTMAAIEIHQPATLCDHRTLDSITRFLNIHILEEKHLQVVKVINLSRKFLLELNPFGWQCQYLELENLVGIGVAGLCVFK
ncbi:uncharacterized protein MYCFIDRAFT_171129 [Pseudocercospora fijiensis CIRAD86]|uniref:Uncharacterized protein n=1 Tax=Pseudocercospora fijiensis (strain CIRAD86) TaxID=383855 RepID=N1QA32_PSEFD|nr:uncharacterized protein MYCFIDRAFT_171129 [Pseudocercospora fijiensis CIRAD86]EME89719.1 hypothetical protein MYCFIDRAFT_171129 [Pseudocercospora fijiensis CIRAD86]